MLVFCFSYFSDIMVKHMTRTTYKRKGSFGLVVSGVRVHDGRSKAWWQKQLRAYVSEWRVGPESILGMAQVF